MSDADIATKTNTSASWVAAMAASLEDDNCEPAARLLRALLAERDAALAEVKRLREALTKISQSTGCVEACPCWQRLRIKARAALAKEADSDR